MSSNSEITKKYKYYIKVIKEHNHFYYNNDKPIISDSEYDKIKKELNRLEEKHIFLKKLNLTKNISQVCKIYLPSFDEYQGDLNNLKLMLNDAN